MVKDPPLQQAVSMTGFAARRGQGAGYEWSWDLRSVNGKGFDLRLRVPDWIDGLEQALRAEVARVAQRGNISLSLRVSRSQGAAEVRVNPDTLRATMAALAEIEAAARGAGLTLAPSTPAEVLALRGVADVQAEAEDSAPLLAALLADAAGLLADFAAARRAEGAALAGVIGQQLDRIGALVEDAAAAAEARRPLMQKALAESLSRVMAEAPGADPDRVAQELALLAVKADVTEEIDRLRAHVAAARGLLSAGGAIGRRFDFLMQEFMREANTLCSKSGDRELTRIGLDLKTVIDQLREQVQNVE
ncbi:MAG: YicC family protein [Rhodobacteraceae bacterium]|nr:YicC family protein [Paracoccaceae bacterium]